MAAPGGVRGVVAAGAGGLRGACGACASLQAPLHCSALIRSRGRFGVRGSRVLCRRGWEVGSSIDPLASASAAAGAGAAHLLVFRGGLQDG